jgi:hypothetical protein
MTADDCAKTTECRYGAGMCPGCVYRIPCVTVGAIGTGIDTSAGVPVSGYLDGADSGGIVLRNGVDTYHIFKESFANVRGRDGQALFAREQNRG